MVWKSFNIRSKKIELKRIENNKKSAENIIFKKNYIFEKTLLHKSGVVHGINELTGKKVKDAFVMVQLKNFLKKQKPNTNKKIIYKKNFNKIKNSNMFKNVEIKKIPDSNRLSANSIDSKNLMNSKSILDIKNKEFLLNNSKSVWNSRFSGSIINNKQTEYLNFRNDLIYANYLKNTTYKENFTFMDMVKGHRFGSLKDAQFTDTFNNFTRIYTYKNLLFKSFWFNKFVSTLVRQGKKLRVWSYILRTFGFLKNEFGRNPIVLLFEILELYRMPVRGLPPKSSTRKSVIRTHLIPWWKQYTQILRWVRHALTGSVKNSTSWNFRIKVEMLNLLNDSNSSLVKKRIESNFQLIAFGKIALHFRWHRRYSKRAVKAIQVADRSLLEK